ncbi:hypothetical protein EPN28_03600 [Patescibacteria group bacterium]|nr:MAG: hypothetical protein EPN28_03600 [Patescibacteria group bacterium]
MTNDVPRQRFGMLEKEETVYKGNIAVVLRSLKDDGIDADWNAETKSIEVAGGNNLEDWQIRKLEFANKNLRKLLGVE